MPRSISTNFDIQGSVSEMKLPLDFRYGPWSSLSIAEFWVANPSLSMDKTYYGMTVGIIVKDKTTGNIIGVDEYWWQPKCKFNEVTGEYSDGFIKKVPSNTPDTVDKSDSVNVLGISDENNDYSIVYKNVSGGGGDPIWHYL